MEALGANLRFGAAPLLGDAGDPLCERDSAPLSLGVGLFEVVESSSSASSSTLKLIFGVPALRFGFFFGGSEGVEVLY